ncbi:heterokaryon incompatibility protein-domain-containing protein, partial [Podospora aff. communis PSN243]
MFLINTVTCELENMCGREPMPRYAILSHTWDRDEISFQDLESGAASTGRQGYRKVMEACRLARDEGLNYVWIDTCCVDKKSSAELSEAINSMYRWYHDASVCYAYLADLSPGEDFQKCRWFSRGWTLQELIAPQELRFYDSHWNLRGAKKEMTTLLSDITKIRKEVLEDSDEVHCVPVAEKMSWAAGRETSRPEDMAYCLLGIFDINMSLLYGEGPRAFRRLQERILHRTNDMSLLAWAPAGSEKEAPPELREIFARGPRDFSWIATENITLNVTSQFISELEITSKGLRTLTLL